MSHFYYGTKPIGKVAVSFAGKNGGTDTSDATLTSGGQMLQGITAYGANGKVTGTIETKNNTDLTVNKNVVTIPKGYYTTNVSATISEVSLSAPTIALNDANGLVTSNITQSSGYVNGATKSATLQLSTKGANHYTPTKSSQAIDGGVYLIGDQIIDPIPDNYIDTTDATAVASDILSGTTAYVNGSKVTGSMTNNGTINQTLDTNTTSYTIPNGYHNGNGIVNILTETKTITPSTSTQAVSASNGKVISSVTVNPIPSNFIDIDHNTVTAPTPTISVSAGGLITASVNNPKGYQISATTKSATKQLTVKAAATYTPSTVDQTITSGQYLTGTQTIQGDANLVPENIASGVSIFGVTGTHEGGSGIDTSDADATSADIIKDKTAYVNGVKLTGTLVVQNYYTGATAPDSSLGNNGDLYFKV